MTVLSYQTLKVRIEEGLIEPSCEREVIRGKSFGLSHCGYDIRVKLPDTERVFTNGEGVRAIHLRPGDFLLASTVERIKMPNDLVAIVHDKSSWARQGVALQNTVLEPGWEGWITLEITTHRDTVTIYDGDPIAQLIFHLLDAPTERPYVGKYQNQADGAVEAINEISKD